MDLPVFAKRGGIAPIGVFNELWCTPAIAATCGMCFKIKVQPGYESARCKRDGFFAHPECPGTVDADHSYAAHPGMEWAFNYAVYYDDPDGIPYIIGMNVEYVGGGGRDRSYGEGGQGRAGGEKRRWFGGQVQGGGGRGDQWLARAAAQWQPRASRHRTWLLRQRTPTDLRRLLLRYCFPPPSRERA